MTESLRTVDCSPPDEEGTRAWRGYCTSTGGGLSDPRESCELILAELDRLSLLVRFCGKKGKESRLQLSDVVSVELLEDGGMEIVAYELRGGKRWRDCYRFANGSSASILPFATRLKAAFTTKDVVKPWPHRPRHDEYNEERPRILVVVNLFSGQGKAMDLWRKHAQPIFADLREAGVPYELVYEFTLNRGHATRLAMNLDLERYGAVAIVSGDGLVAEWIYGLLQRSDHLRALKLPILHIPGGTSNGLAAAVAYQCNEPFPPRGVFYRQMALMLVSARARRFRALRLHHVEIAPASVTSDEEEKDREVIHRPMFMSMSWGLFADIDICSERFRWAGMIRLHMEAFLRLVRLPSVAKYKGRISYLPVTDKEMLRRTRLKLQSSRIAFGKHHFDGEEVEEWSGPTAPSHQVTIEETFRNQHVVEAPSLAEPVPHNWDTIEAEFVYVCLISLSHIGSDLPYHPSAKLEEEVFYLSFVDWRILKSRLHMAHLMININRCCHLDQRCLQVVPVLACRVEPAKGTGGNVALDGEVVCPAGSSFQVVSSKLKATVVAREASASESA